MVSLAERDHKQRPSSLWLMQYQPHSLSICSARRASKNLLMTKAICNLNLVLICRRCICDVADSTVWDTSLTNENMRRRQLEPAPSFPVGMPAKLHWGQLRRHAGGKDWDDQCCRPLLFSYRNSIPAGQYRRPRRRWIRSIWEPGFTYPLFMIFSFDSALATVLSDAKANVGNTPNVAAPQSVAMDDSVFMLALAIFILSAPKEIVLASDLQSQCINVFNRCITSTNIQVSRLFCRSFRVRAKIFY